MKSNSYYIQYKKGLQKPVKVNLLNNIPKQKAKETTKIALNLNKNSTKRMKMRVGNSTKINLNYSNNKDDYYFTKNISSYISINKAMLLSAYEESLLILFNNLKIYMKNDISYFYKLKQNFIKNVQIFYQRNKNKNCFSTLLQPFLTENIFPKDVLTALQKHLNHIKASSTADLNLQRVLQKYDKQPENVTILENLPNGTRFTLKNGLIFQKGEKQRTRYKCYCESNGRWYFVSALAEVKVL